MDDGWWCCCCCCCFVVVIVVVFVMEAGVSWFSTPGKGVTNHPPLCVNAFLSLCRESCFYVMSCG